MEEKSKCASSKIRGCWHLLSSSSGIQFPLYNQYLDWNALETWSCAYLDFIRTSRI